MSIAPLSTRLLMMPREMPSFLSTAYSLRYKDQPLQGNVVQKVITVFQRYVGLIKEILYRRNQISDFKTNILKFIDDFAEIRKKLDQSDKPICAYFVSAIDHNGAILGNNLYYYHHYKIKNFEKDYAVAPFMVADVEQLKSHLEALKRDYPTREIKVVDIVSHGSSESLVIPKDAASSDKIAAGNIESIDTLQIGIEDVKEDTFAACANDAVIILDACNTAEGTRNIAREIASKNLGKTVLAPEGSMFFSKPVITKKDGKPVVTGLVHGPAIFSAYSAKKYHYTLPQEHTRSAATVSVASAARLATA